jgi:hypothetical protein
MKLRRPSPALLISIMALVVACTGTAFAATLITSSAQIKNGIVMSADIKDGSLQSQDLKKGAVFGVNLSPGLNKQISAGNDTVAYEIVRNAGPENQPANVLARVATLKVPAGAYAITAKTIVTALPPPQNPIQALVQENGAIGGRCKLDAAGVTDESLQNVVINQRQTPATLTMQLTRTVGAPADIVLDCSAGLPWRLSETSIMATKVGSIIQTEEK